MNLKKLFEMQKELDERILDRFPELRNEDLLDKKILALQVELGELAQNWRGFKFWSENRHPRTWYARGCHSCNGRGYFSLMEEDDEMCSYCEGSGIEEEKNPLLEEFVDCLHFILSIGNELGDYDYNASSEFQDIANITDFLSFIFEAIPRVKNSIKHKDLTAHGRTVAISNYEVFIGMFLKLGDKLGFTWEQIEQAYYDKNKINHERQDSNY